MVESDPRQTIEQLAEKLNSSWSCVQEHLQQIGKVNRQGVWVSHELSKENRSQGTAICNSLITRQEREPFLHRIVTGDEKWVLYVNAKRKHQWLSPGQTPVPTAKPGLHPQKVLCVWWDCIGIIHFEVLEMDQTITADLYCQQLDRLHQALIEKRPALVNRKGVILQHDNAKPHTARITQQKIRDLGREVLLHPHTHPTPRHQIIIYSDLLSTFLVEKHSGILMRSKQQSRISSRQSSPSSISRVSKI